VSGTGEGREEVDDEEKGRQDQAEGGDFIGQGHALSMGGGLGAVKVSGRRSAILSFNKQEEIEPRTTQTSRRKQISLQKFVSVRVVRGYFKL
jgi:hypothetical protein